MREIEPTAIPQQESVRRKSPLHREMFVYDPALYSLGQSLPPWPTPGCSLSNNYSFRLVRQLGLGTPDFLSVTRALSVNHRLASQSASIGRSFLILVVIDALTIFGLHRFRIRVRDSKSTTIMIEAGPELVRRAGTWSWTSVVNSMDLFTRRICLGMVILNLTLY